MKIKQEVLDLCYEFRDTERGTAKWHKLKTELMYKWKFSAYSLVAMYYIPPVIEYDMDNYHLIMEEE